MATLNVSDAAKHAQVSVRTLHHYDRIKLLQPSIRTSNGYRFYTPEDMQKLFNILLYRALGFSLKEITSLVNENASPIEKERQLKQQLVQIEQHILRLKNIQKQLEKTLKKEETDMKTTPHFDDFNGFDPDQHEEEAKQKWGETDAYKISKKRTQNYSKADWQRYQDLQMDLNRKMIALIKRAESPSSQAAIEVAEQMRLLIDEWFYPCSREMHAQLGNMYIADARFTETYEQHYTGLAAFIQKATDANWQQNGN